VQLGVQELHGIAQQAIAALGIQPAHAADVASEFTLPMNEAMGICSNTGGWKSSTRLALVSGSTSAGGATI
jgi:hypothetical protein